MKYVDEFRNPAIVNGMLDAIRVQLKKIEAKRQPKGKKGQKMRPLQLMEFCGGHTHTLFKYGIENLLPDSIEWCMAPVVRSVYCQWGALTNVFRLQKDWR